MCVGGGDFRFCVHSDFEIELSFVFQERIFTTTQLDETVRRRSRPATNKVLTCAIHALAILMKDVPSMRAT